MKFKNNYITKKIKGYRLSDQFLDVMTKSLTNRVTPTAVAATNTNVQSNGVSFDDFIYLCVKLQVYIKLYLKTKYIHIL